MSSENHPELANTKSINEVKQFYNQFTHLALKKGINLRHYHVFNEIVRDGLRREHKVLEIGCGIGQVTSLIHSYLKKGKLVATDISPDSIEAAKKLIGPSLRIEFFVTDMTDFSYPSTFDYIILPDVLEHIPKENHFQLFSTLSSLMHDRSRMIIHIPHPKLIEYDQKNNPEILQIIDQPLFADEILKNIYSHGLVLEKYDAYSLYHAEHDYIFLTIRKNVPIKYVADSRLKIILKKSKERIRFLINNL